MNNFLKFYKKYGMFCLLLGVVVLFAVLRPATFLTKATFLNILKQSSVIGTLSCGIMMIIITGSTDISAGGRVAFVTCVCGYMAIARVNIVLIILTAILIGVITGALNAILAEKLQTGVFVITIATNNIWYGFSYIMTSGIMLTGFGDDIKAISQTKVIGDIPSIGVVWIACALIVSFILDKTRFGRHVYALGGNRGAAFLAGINVAKTNIVVHALAGVFLGIGSLLLLSRSMSAIASSGSTYAFDCITACVLGGVMLGGGRGKVYQCVMGVLVINVIFNGLTICGISDFVRQVITGLVLVFAIAMEVLQRKTNTDLTDDTAGGRDAERAGKKSVQPAK